MVARRSVKSVMPVVAGKSLKFPKFLAAGGAGKASGVAGPSGSGEAGDVHFVGAGLKKYEFKNSQA